MIFKTFNSDIDKISSKWGMFGLSFNDIGTTIIGRITDINKAFQATNGDLIGSLKDSDSILKRLYPSKESIKDQLIDIDALFPKQDDSYFSSKLNKLVAFNQKVSDGSKKWQDYFKNLSDGEKWQIEFVQNTDLQKASLSDVKKAYDSARASALAHNEALKQLTLGAKAGKVALQALATVGNMFAMWAITKGIELAVKGIDNLIHASEKEKEKLKEIRQQTHESVEAYKQEQADLDSTIEKYKDLNEQLTNASLTTEEYNSIKTQLSSLQNDLVSKYGEEASAIDVVNGKYDEQIKKLDAISKKKAQDFVNENSSNIQEDWNFLNDTISIKNPKIFTDMINNHVKSSYGSYDSHIRSSYEGTPEEIRKQINTDMDALRERYGNTDMFINAHLSALSELLKKDEISSEQINQSKESLLTFAKTSVDSNSEIQSAYDALVDGIEQYNNALETGEGVDKAYSNYEKLREEFKNVSADILGMDELYKDLSSKINEPLNISFKLDTNIENGRKSTQKYLDKLQGVTSDQLRSFDYDDLLSVNSLNNYEDAFGHLVKQLGVSEAGVDALIDRLIELGYVTDSVDIQNKENILNALGFDKNASSANAAKRNITANNMYNSLTDEGIYY